MYFYPFPLSTCCVCFIFCVFLFLKLLWLKIFPAFCSHAFSPPLLLSHIRVLAVLIPCLSPGWSGFTSLPMISNRGGVMGLGVEEGWEGCWFDFLHRNNLQKKKTRPKHNKYNTLNDGNMWSTVGTHVNNVKHLIILGLILFLVKAWSSLKGDLSISSISCSFPSIGTFSWWRGASKWSAPGERKESTLRFKEN